MCHCANIATAVYVCVWQVPQHAKHKPFIAMDLLTPSKDCGWGGMDVQQCYDRGCDWKPADPPTNPWCTYTGPNQRTKDDVLSVEPF